jgi:hypothetical protein
VVGLGLGPSPLGAGRDSTRHWAGIAVSITATLRCGLLGLACAAKVEPPLRVWVGFVGLRRWRSPVRAAKIDPRSRLWVTRGPRFQTHPARLWLARACKMILSGNRLSGRIPESLWNGSAHSIKVSNKWVKGILTTASWNILHTVVSRRDFSSVSQEYHAQGIDR